MTTRRIAFLLIITMLTAACGGGTSTETGEAGQGAEASEGAGTTEPAANVATVEVGSSGATLTDGNFLVTVDRVTDHGQEADTGSGTLNVNGSRTIIEVELTFRTDDPASHRSDSVKAAFEDSPVGPVVMCDLAVAAGIPRRCTDLTGSIVETYLPGGGSSNHALYFVAPQGTERFELRFEAPEGGDPPEAPVTEEEAPVTEQEAPATTAEAATTIPEATPAADSEMCVIQQQFFDRVADDFPDQATFWQERLDDLALLVDLVPADYRAAMETYLDGQTRYAELIAPYDYSVRDLVDDLGFEAIDAILTDEVAAAFEQIEIFLVAACATADVDPSTIWIDGFNGDLRPGWRWVLEEPGAWSLSDRPGSLQITAGDTTQNLLVRDAPDGRYLIQAGLRFQPTSNLQFAGLMVTPDPLVPTFIQFGRQYCDPSVADECVGDGIYLDLVEDGRQTGAWVAEVDPDARSVDLLLIATGTSYEAWYRPIGEDEWTAVGKVDGALGEIEVGLIAHHAFEEPIDALFHYFTITAPFTGTGP